MNDKDNLVKNQIKIILQDINDKQNIYAKYRQQVKGPELTKEEKGVVVSYSLENWIQDTKRVKQIKCIEKIYDFIFENENRWPKFMQSVKSLSKCMIDDTNVKVITLDVPFLWKGETFVLCYTPGDPYDTFFIKSSLESFFTIRPGSTPSQSRESIEKKKRKYDEIIDHLDVVLAETLDYLLCGPDLNFHSCIDAAIRVINKEALNEKEWLYFKVGNNNPKAVCCKILDELEKVLE